MLLDDLLEGLYTEPPESEGQKLTHDALRRYFAFHEADRAKDAIMHRIFRSIPGSDANLERQNLELDVEFKKRRMAMLPYQDSDEFNDALNSHQKGALAALGIHLGESLPHLPRAKRFGLF